MYLISINNRQKKLLKLACEHLINELQDTDINSLTSRQFIQYQDDIELLKAMIGLLFTD